ncbi:sulfur carrier protein ThiS [Coriobacterium glomerans PW2]|uniref:Sulfur carrier protein ThiS n=1 Tax=Coriobacterium glomerans (strain ATCC 49209 / DSM 20642 / JCM 10262 / PW2) TaxID=700015 RepID=F2N7A2_CORGP|nr:sulfur carrier protein ThiS [Coriobacterium glomerans]AEB06577.1 sulfur carrier protein ThiS [Coriobacterium glomerans PW2]
MAQVNGVARADVIGMPLDELLAAEGYDPCRVACEADGEIVARANYHAHRIAADEQLEIVSFVGGG